MDQKYEMKSLADADVQARLANASPLDVCQTLTSMELYNQQSSLEVVEEIYQEFEGGGATVETLLKPLVISLVDVGLAKVKFLKSEDGKRSVKIDKPKKGREAAKDNGEGTPASDLLSGAVIWEAIMEFSYDNPNAMATDPYNEQQLAQTRSESLKVQNTGEYNRLDYVNKKSNGDPSGSAQKAFRDKTFKEKGLQRVHAVQEGKYVRSDTGNPEADHIVALKAAKNQYAPNLAVTDEMVRHAIDHEDNMQWTSKSFNASKGEMTAQQIAEQRDIDIANGKDTPMSKLTDEQLETIKQHEQEAIAKAEEKMSRAFWGKDETDPEKRKQVIKENLKNMGGEAAELAKSEGVKQALRMGVAEFIKVTIFEIKDMILNGVKKAVGKSTLLAAIEARIKRIMSYLKRRVWPAIKESLSSIFQTVLREIVSSLPTILTGMFRKVMDLVSAGFDAIMQSAKILMAPKEKMSAAEKADALMKVFIAAATPFITMAVLQLPLGPFEELAEAVLGGIISCVLVWAVDKADIFNTKAEKRSRRVKEVFEHRVSVIKQNIDIFDKAATEKYLQQKAAFDAMQKQINDALDNNQPVGELSTKLADFMGAGSKITIRDTATFAKLLEQNAQLTI